MCIEYITIEESKPVSIKLMKEVILFHTGIEYNEQNTWTDLGAYYTMCLKEINKQEREG